MSGTLTETCKHCARPLMALRGKHWKHIATQDGFSYCWFDDASSRDYGELVTAEPAGDCLSVASERIGRRRR